MAEVKAPKDALRAFRGTPRKVQRQMAIELGVIIILWVAFIFISPMRLDNVDAIAWVMGPLVMFYWAFMRLAPFAYLPCCICEGRHNKSDEPPCSECSMRVEMPSHFERYEPKTFKERCFGNDYIPKASRATWKDGRWRR